MHRKLLGLFCARVDGGLDSRLRGNDGWKAGLPSP